MPEPFGLTATGAIAAEDMFTIGDIGQGQELAVPMFVVVGHIPAVDMYGTGVVGADKPASPVKGNRKVNGYVKIHGAVYFWWVFIPPLGVRVSLYILSGTSIPSNFIALLIVFAVAADNCSLNCFTFSSSTFKICLSW